MENREVIAATLAILVGVPMAVMALRYLYMDVRFYSRCNWDFSKQPEWGRRWRNESDYQNFSKKRVLPPIGKTRLRRWAVAILFGLFIAGMPFIEFEFSTYWHSLVSLSKRAILSLL